MHLLDTIMLDDLCDVYLLYFILCIIMHIVFSLKSCRNIFNLSETQRLPYVSIHYEYSCEKMYLLIRKSDNNPYNYKLGAKRPGVAAKAPCMGRVLAA